MRLYFSGTPAEFKEVAQDIYGVQAESSVDDDYGDGSQLLTADGEIILCGTVCQVAEEFFTIRLGETINVVQIFGEVLQYPQWTLAVDDFIQVKVRFQPVQTAEGTFAYQLIADKLVGHIWRRK